MTLQEFIDWVNGDQASCWFFCPPKRPRGLETVYSTIQQLNDSMSEDQKRRLVLQSCKTQLSLYQGTGQVSSNGSNYQCDEAGNATLAQLVEFYNENIQYEPRAVVADPSVMSQQSMVSDRRVPELTVAEQQQLTDISLMIKVFETPVLEKITPAQLTQLTGKVSNLLPDMLRQPSVHPQLRQALQELFEAFRELTSKLAKEVKYFNQLLREEELENVATEKFKQKINSSRYSLEKAKKEIVKRHMYFLHMSHPKSIPSNLKQARDDVLQLAAYGPEGQRNGFYKAFMLLDSGQEESQIGLDKMREPLREAQDTMLAALRDTVTKSIHLLEQADEQYEASNNGQRKPSWRHYPSEKKHLTGRWCASYHLLNHMLVGTTRDNYVLFKREKDMQNQSFRERQEQSSFPEEYRHFETPYGSCVEAFRSYCESDKVKLDSLFSGPVTLAVAPRVMPYTVEQFTVEDADEVAGPTAPLLGSGSGLGI